MYSAYIDFVERNNFDKFLLTTLAQSSIRKGAAPKYHLDCLEVSEGELSVRGWVFDSKRKFSPDLIYLRAEDSYMVIACAVRRPDVMRVFDLSSEMVGFHVSLNMKGRKFRVLNLGFVNRGEVSEVGLLKNGRVIKS